MYQEDLVSIIVATYNRASVIGETLDSVICQTYSNWECIIVDDGSTDSTQQLVQGYMQNEPRIKYFVRPETLVKGPNSTRNYGIKKSIGSFIMSLDSDDWILENHLEAKMAIFNSNLAIDAVLSKTIMVDNDKNELMKEHRTFLTDNILEDFITLKVSWYMHDLMWRRSFLENKELYNENLLKWLDRDFHIRRLSEFPKIYLLDDFLSMYRIHPNSNSSNGDYKTLETRHQAVLDIIDVLNYKKILTPKMKLFFFKFQVQNLVVLYKSPSVFTLYRLLIKKTFMFKFNYLKWILKLVVGFVAFKITGRGLIIIK
jgi:glycosyltransferase involved in cell wall biosynthesis